MLIASTETGEPVRTLDARASTVIVRLDPRPETYKPDGAIVTSDYSYVQPTSGTVISAGRDTPRELTPGTRVGFGKFNGLRLPYTADGEPVYAMRADYAKPLPYVPDVYYAIEAAE